jgi:hypothetical protein
MPSGSSYNAPCGARPQDCCLQQRDKDNPRQWQDWHDSQTAAGQWQDLPRSGHWQDTESWTVRGWKHYGVNDVTVNQPQSIDVYRLENRTLDHATPSATSQPPQCIGPCEYSADDLDHWSDAIVATIRWTGHPTPHRVRGVRERTDSLAAGQPMTWAILEQALHRPIPRAALPYIVEHSFRLSWELVNGEWAIAAKRPRREVRHRR